MRMLLPLALIMIGACAPAMQPVVSTPTVLKSYSIDAIQEAGIGDPIFDVQAVRQALAFVATEAHDPGGPIGLRRRKIETGQIFRVVGQLATGAYVVRSPASSGDRYSLVITSEGRVEGFWDSTLRSASGGSWPDTPLFRQVEVPEQEGAFRAEMIYSGLDGQTLRAAYREFAGDLIRPAFTQDLQYDLSQDSTIAYKSIRIQVLEATNSQLRFRVLEDGDLEWLPEP